MRDWKEMRRAGMPEEVLLTAAARSLPPATAHQVVWAAAVTKNSEGGRRALASAMTRMRTS